MPVEGDAGLFAGGFDDGDGGGADLGTDAVAGDEGDVVGGQGIPWLLLVAAGCWLLVASCWWVVMVVWF